MAEKDKELIENIEKQEYKYGFTSDIETETIPRGLNEEVVRLISTKKGEPEWMTALFLLCRKCCRNLLQNRKEAHVGRCPFLCRAGCAAGRG